jgi:hypothetical protein
MHQWQALTALDCPDKNGEIPLMSGTLSGSLLVIYFLVKQYLVRDDILKEQISMKQYKTLKESFLTRTVDGDDTVLFAARHG